MPLTIQLSTLFVAIVGVGFAEAARRHVACARFARDLRRAADIHGHRT